VTTYNWLGTISESNLDQILSLNEVLVRVLETYKIHNTKVKQKMGIGTMINLSRYVNVICYDRISHTTKINGIIIE